MNCANGDCPQPRDTAPSEVISFRDSKGKKKARNRSSAPHRRMTRERQPSPSTDEFAAAVLRWQLIVVTGDAGKGF
jgi:hypothetical protein